MAKQSKDARTGRSIRNVQRAIWSGVIATFAVLLAACAEEATPPPTASSIYRPSLSCDDMLMAGMEHYDEVQDAAEINDIVRVIQEAEPYQCASTMWDPEVRTEYDRGDWEEEPGRPSPLDACGKEQIVRVDTYNKKPIEDALARIEEHEMNEYEENPDGLIRAESGDILVEFTTDGRPPSGARCWLITRDHWPWEYNWR